MEDVLDVYCQPYDPAVPRICMDEMGKNLVKDKYPPSQPNRDKSHGKAIPSRKRAAPISSLSTNPWRANAA